MRHLIGCAVEIPSSRNVSKFSTDEWGRVVCRETWEEYMQRGVVIDVYMVEGAWVALVRNADLGKCCEYRANWLWVTDRDHRLGDG
jgi:hypothetical protein